MFRTQPNAFDEVVGKATDENLTSENWEYILDVCDRVQGSETGPKDAVAAMIKRLAHRNANVQLYTLELANALSQNCGIELWRELASRSFTDALLRLAGDRTTHQQVKSKILERLSQWSTMFSAKPELGIMEQAYAKLKSQNPNLQPPQAPTKREITLSDRQKEEEELQMALKLSVQDKPAPSSQASEQKSNVAELSGQSNTVGPAQTATSQSMPSGTTAATVSRVRALFDFQPSEPGELQFRKGDVIAVLESVYQDWWRGSLRGQTGIFPLNYVEKLSDPSQEELQKEAQMEAEVFAQIKNVEKLLTLLSTGSGQTNGRDNEEITDLYHQTVGIRPKLIELIGKYSQKKDDFQQLNEKFIKARRDYEALLEQSMAQPQYGRSSAQQGYGYGAGAGPSATSPRGLPVHRFYASQPESQPPNGGPSYAAPSQQQPPTQQQLPYPTVTPPGSTRIPSNQRSQHRASTSAPSPPQLEPYQQPLRQHPSSTAMYPQSLQSASRPGQVPPNQSQAPAPQSYAVPPPQELGPNSPPGASTGSAVAPPPPPPAGDSSGMPQNEYQQQQPPRQPDYPAAGPSPEEGQQSPHQPHHAHQLHPQPSYAQFPSTQPQHQQPQHQHQQQHQPPPQPPQPQGGGGGGGGVVGYGNPTPQPFAAHGGSAPGYGPYGYSAYPGPQHSGQQHPPLSSPQQQEFVQAGNQASHYR